MSILDALKEDNYRIGDGQALDFKMNRAMFPENYLATVYERLKGDMFSSKRPNGTGVLEMTFCGMQDLSFDAIVPYLASVPLAIMGVWNGDTFHDAGFIFPVSFSKGAAVGQRSTMAGYAFFREFWGSEYSEALAMLGIALIFSELSVEVIHGMRYRQNDSTMEFLKRFGFRDVGVHPLWMLRRGKLVDGVSSYCLRKDFESYVEQALVEGYAGGQGI